MNTMVPFAFNLATQECYDFYATLKAEVRLNRSQGEVLFDAVYKSLSH